LAVGGWFGGTGERAWNPLLVAHCWLAAGRSMFGAGRGPKGRRGWGPHRRRLRLPRRTAAMQPAAAARRALFGAAVQAARIRVSTAALRAAVSRRGRRRGRPRYGAAAGQPWPQAGAGYQAAPSPIRGSVDPLVIAAKCCQRCTKAPDTGCFPCPELDIDTSHVLLVLEEREQQH
jgi:hypothetical protein